MKNKNIRKSFIGYCVFYFSIYAIIVLLLFVLINGIVNKKRDRYIPNLSYLLEYEDYLKEDSFNKIPLKKFKRSDFVIFDQNNNIIFKTDNNKRININSSDLEFINDYYSDSYFNIYEYKDNYLIIKTRFEEDSKYENISDYVVLDKNLNIIEGNIFNNKESLTNREFNLLKGVNGNSNYVEKYNYETSDGRKRTLIFIEPIFNNKLYNKAIKNSIGNWLYLIIGIFILIVIVTYLFYRRINRFIMPIKNAIDNYEYDTLDEIDDKDIPKEFENLFISFKVLLNKLKEEKNKSLSMYKERQRIIANLSHDLKTPLTVIGGYAKAYIDKVIKDEDKDKYLNTIYNKSIEASNIIDTLSLYTLIEHPEYKMNIESINLNEFLNNYLSNKEKELELSGYKLEYNLDNLDVIIDIDKNLILRMFENLINNSVKYNKKGITIYIESKVISNNKVKISVGDNGVGISKKLSNSLFKPFVVGDESRSNNTGTGLGLSIVKRIVDMHDGIIKYVNKPKSPVKFQVDIIFNIKKN